MTEHELVELGLYDPEAPDAPERLELLQIAFKSGATVDEARDAIAEGRASLPVMDAVLRHHVVAAGRRYSLWGVRPTERSTTDAVVGFADLVGFTTLGQHLDPAEVDTLIRRFEELALDATTRRPLSRLVKLIGDEALFVAGDMTSALEIADDLARDPDLPPLRVGLAAGVIIVREGDVFGPVVNLASRLVELAEPGQVLLDGGAALRLGSERCESLGLRTIDGFDQPLEVFAVP